MLGIKLRDNTCTWVCTWRRMKIKNTTKRNEEGGVSPNKVEMSLSKLRDCFSSRLFCSVIEVHSKWILSNLGLFLCDSSQTTNSAADRDGTGSRQSVCSSGQNFAAWPAFPDSYASTLDRVLSAEDAPVRRVLGDLHFPDDLTESGTVPGSVLSGDSNLFRALSHSDVLSQNIIDLKKLKTTKAQKEWVAGREISAEDREWTIMRFQVLNDRIRSDRSRLLA